MIGLSLGSYTIQRELGRGGMGAVYVGYHQLLGRPAAIKVLLPEYSRNQEIVQRFFNEARAATAIRHPGIVEVYDFGFATDGSAYIVMELCDGESLAARLRRVRVLPAATALGFARQIAGALAAAHKTGIVHRDLKPDNVFLVPDAEVAGGERLKLLDFGIAKLGEGSGGGGPGMMARTSTGALMGTPYYMSPEQCRGAGHVDARSDLYALGCILFEMVCGRVPFEGEGVGDIIGAHLHVAPPQPRSLAPGLPPAAEGLILGLLAKKPDERIPTADAVVTQIRAIAAASGMPEVSGGYPIAAPPMSGPMTAPAPVLTPPPMAATVATLAGPVATPPSYPPPTTTLGAAAAQVAPARRASKAPWIAGGVLVCAGAVAAIVIASGGSSKQADDASAIAGSAHTSAIVLDAAAVAIAAPPDAAPPPPDAEEGHMGRRDGASGATPPDAASDDDSMCPGMDADFAEITRAVSKAVELHVCKAAMKFADAFEARNPPQRCPSGAKVGELRNAALACTPKATATPQIVAPSSITLIAGTKQIVPDDATRSDIQRSGKDQVIASYKLCFDETGAPASVTRLKSSGFDAYDAKIDRALHAWRIKPYMVNGGAVAVCTAPMFIYKAPPASEPEADTPASADCSNAAQLTDDAAAAAKNTQWGKALHLCEQALACHGGDQVQTVMVCGLAACNLKNAAKAKHYVGLLSGQRAFMLKQSCIRNGITID